jgi:hypothetical protein
MKKEKSVINSIKKNIGIYINNTYEFNNILNNNCIIVGGFILSHINNIYKYNTENHNKDIIDIYCTKYKYNELKKYLINNNFIINENINISLNNKNLANNIIIEHEYTKQIYNNKLIIKISLTDNPIKYMNDSIQLNIEKNYYNGVLLIIGYPKSVILKKDTIYINSINEIFDLNVIKYILYGYEFKLIDITNKNTLIINGFNKYKMKSFISNYIKYLSYKCKIKK